MKRFMLFTALLAMLGLSLSACGGDKKEAPGEASENLGENAGEQGGETDGGDTNSEGSSSDNSAS